MDIIQILSIIVSLGIFLFVVESIRRGALKEKYALLWLFASVILLIFSIWRKLLDIVALALGFNYPPSFLFLLGFGVLLLITLHFSIVISRLADKNKKLAQELGLVNDALKQIKSTFENQHIPADSKKSEEDRAAN